MKVQEREQGAGSREWARSLAVLGGSAAIALTLSIAACGAGSGTLQLKFAHVGPPGSLYDVIIGEFARRVNERLGERAQVVTFGSSQLGNDEVLLQKLKLGTIDITLTSTVMSSTIDEFALFEMPYLVRDRDHMLRIEREVFWPELAPLAEAQGYKVLALWENGFRHLTNNVRPITVPQDLQGIKLRTPRSPWRIKLFQALGANPSPMSFSEVFVALQTGVMDGQENPLANIYSGKLHEVQDFLSLTGHVYSPAYLTVGSSRWVRLPQDVREVIERVAGEMREFVYATAEQMDAELLRTFRASGVVINEPDREPFLEASRVVYEEFANAVPGGRELVDRVLPLANQ
jgi:tripartite ATP-independent transporter DctP family solute receptor